MVKKNYYELINGQLDPNNINFLLEDKLSSYENDNRPVISRKIDLYSDSIYNIEKEKIEVLIKKFRNNDLVSLCIQQVFKDSDSVFQLKNWHDLIFKFYYSLILRNWLLPRQS